MFTLTRVKKNLQILTKILNKHSKTTKTLSRNATNNGPTPISMAYVSYENTSTTTPKGSPLLILHGLYGAKSNWQSICKAMQLKLKPERKIIGLDARNHGDSPHVAKHGIQEMASDIGYFLEEHGIEKASLMGHSMGGRAVMYFALKHVSVREMRLN